MDEWNVTTSTQSDEEGETLQSVTCILLIGTRNSSGLETVEVTNANNYTLSSILKDVKIQQHLKSVTESDGQQFVEQLKIVCSTLFTVDCDLPQATWHGSNIYIIAEQMYIEGQCIWNLSGLHAVGHMKAPDGTSSGEDGTDGCDKGASGESGGNVMLCCSAVTGDKLEIISCGGNGGRGQDGGNGADGENGKDGVSLSIEEFKDKFPPIAKNNGTSYGRNIDRTLNNLPVLVSDKTIWLDGEYLDTVSALRQKVSNYKTVFFSFYVSGATTVGEKVTVSSYANNVLFPKQAYVLYKGSTGTVGQQGGASGKGGSGGEGGYEGTLRIVSLDGHDFLAPSVFGTFREGYRGDNGRDGKSGRNGASGKSAHDMAYIDSNWKAEAIYYNDGNLQLKHFDSDESDRAWCGYNKKYVKIVSAGRKQLRVIERTFKVKKKAESDWETTAVRKKALTFHSIRSEANKVNEVNELKYQQAVNVAGIKLHSTTERSCYAAKEVHLLRSITDMSEEELERKQRKPVRKIVNVAPGHRAVNYPKISYAQLLIDFQRKLKTTGLQQSINELEHEFLNHCFDKIGTLHDNDSIIHCLFGEKSKLGVLVCKDATDKRIDLINYVTDSLDHISCSAKLAILNFINDCGSSYQCAFDTRSANKEVLACLERHRKEAVVELLDHNSDLFCWDHLRSEYQHYLADSGTKLSIPELALLAECYDFKITLWQEDHTVSTLVLNPDGSVEKHIIMNDMGHFDVAVINTDSLQLELYRQHEVEHLEKLTENKQLQINSFDEGVNELMKHLGLPQYAHVLELLNPEFRDDHDFPDIVSGLGTQLLDGLRISKDELIEVVEFAISAAVNGMRCEPIYYTILFWPQEAWLQKLTLLKIETVVGKLLKTKSKIDEMVQKIDDINVLVLLFHKLPCSVGEASLSENRIARVLQILALNLLYDEYDLNTLDAIPISSWPYELSYKYWTHLVNLLDTAQNESMENKLTCVCSFLQFENENGIKMAEDLYRIVKNSKIKLSQFKERILYYQWNTQIFTLSDKEFKSVKGKQRVLKDIVNAIQSDGNTAESVKTVSTYDILHYQESLSCVPDVNTHSDVCFFTSWAKSMSNFTVPDGIEDFLPIFCQAVLLLSGNSIRLRPSQLLAIDILLRNSSDNTLAQVSTGEGKTLIIAGVAIAKALSGMTVDIITSNAVLAKRDSSAPFPKGMKDLYQLFGVTVAHICSDEEDTRIEAYTADVVYGDVSLFQKDFLLNTFYGRNILGKRQPANVIVDEVDCMLLDRGNNVLYLSHDIPGMCALESLYLFIWRRVVRGDETFCDIKKATLHDMFGLIEQNDLKVLHCGITDSECRQLYSCLQKYNIIGKDGRLLASRCDIELPANLIKYNARLGYYLQSLLDRPTMINVPRFLYSFIDLHLDEWIENAFRAASYTAENSDYVVCADKTKQSLDLTPQVVIMDKDTGIDLNNSQWDKSLHQFLQLKHGCKLTAQSLKAIFISNVTFIKRYRSLCGLSGTLGSQTERQFLKDSFAVDYVTIPSACVSQLETLTPIVASTELQWQRDIQNEVSTIVTKQKRSILLICFTIGEVDKVRKAIQDLEVDIHVYKRDYEEFEFGGKKELEPQKVIIATNLAGRGTDITVSQKLIKAGGLHVCLTFLPDNVRVEQQAFGRTARKGEAGTCRLIIFSPQDSQLTPGHAMELRRERDKQEIWRLSNLEENYRTNICTQEHYFSKFSEFYKQIHRKCVDAGFKEDLTNILGLSVIDIWAVWLDSVRLESLNSDSQRVIFLFDQQFLCPLQAAEKDMFTKKLQQLTFSDFNWIHNPLRKIQLALHFVENKKTDVAVQLLNDVCTRDSYFAAWAHYYKASAILQQTQSMPPDIFDTCFMKELAAAENKFTNLISEQNAYCGMVRQLIAENGQLVTLADGYFKQKGNHIHILNYFINSIKDLTGHPCLPEDFKESVNDLKNVTYTDLIKMGYMRSVKLNTTSTERLDRICCDYGVDTENIRQTITRATKYNATVETVERELKSLKWISIDNFWEFALTRGYFVNEFECSLFASNSETEKMACTYVQSLTKLTATEHVKQLSDLYHNSFLVTSVPLPVTERSKYWYVKKEDIQDAEQSFFHWIKIAKINPTKLAEYVSFPSSIFSTSTLTRYGIPSADAETVWDFLIHNRIILLKDHQINFLSMRENEDVWKEHELYQQAICVALRQTFAYEVLRQELQNEVTSSPFDEVLIIRGLCSNPCCNFLSDLFEDGVLQQPVVTKPLDDSFWKQFCLTAGIAKEEFEKNLSLQSYFQNKKSTLLGLNAPTLTFTPISDCLQCSTADNNEKFTDELYSFSVDGLDKIITVEEKTHTSATILKALAVIGLGLAQVIGGVLLELYSAGFMTHAAAGLSSEGISDIIFGISALYSGRDFSLADFANHKMQSIATTAVTCGIAAVASRGVRLFKYGYKTFGPNMTILSKEVSKEVFSLPAKTVLKQVLKGCVVKVTSSAFFALLNMGMASFIQRYLSRIISEIGTTLRKACSTNQDLLTKKLSEYLRWRQNGNELPSVTQLISKIFQSKSWLSTLSSKVFGIVRIVMNGLQQAAAKCNKAGVTNLCANVAKYTGNVMIAIDSCRHLTDCINTLQNYSSALISRIDTELSEKRVTQNVQTSEKSDRLNEQVQAHLNDFNKQLDSRCQHIITEFSTFLLQQVGQFVAVKVIHKVKEGYQALKERNLRKRFEALRTKSENSDENGRQLYQEQLMKMLRQSRSPALFAEIIRSGIPLDRTCAGALACYLTECFGKDVVIVVESTDQKYRHQSGNISKDTLVIDVKLDVSQGHYVNSGISGVTSEGDNNCLLDAVKTRLSDISKSGDQSKISELLSLNNTTLRDHIAHQVETDPCVGHAVRQGWHKETIVIGFYGGKIDKTYKNIDEVVADYPSGAYKEVRDSCSKGRNHTIEADHIPPKSIYAQYLRSGNDAEKSPEEMEKINAVRNIKSNDMFAVAIPLNTHRAMQTTFNSKQLNELKVLFKNGEIYKAILLNWKWALETYPQYVKTENGYTNLKHDSSTGLRIETETLYERHQHLLNKVLPDACKVYTSQSLLTSDQAARLCSDLDAYTTSNLRSECPTRTNRSHAKTPNKRQFGDKSITKRRK